MTQQHHWAGKSGTFYDYTIYPIETTWKELPANYIFAKQTLYGWQAIYIGETANMADRMSNHEKLKIAMSMGATSIHAHQSSAVAAIRRAEEADLIRQHNPPLNEQLNSLRTLLT